MPLRKYSKVKEEDKTLKHALVLLYIQNVDNSRSSHPYRSRVSNHFSTISLTKMNLLNFIVFFLDDRKYACDQCQRAYKYPHGLAQHKKYMCGKKPQFHCSSPGCTYQSWFRSDLNRHLRRVHKIIETKYAAKNEVFANDLVKFEDSEHSFLPYNCNQWILNSSTSWHFVLTFSHIAHNVQDHPWNQIKPYQ